MEFDKLFMFIINVFNMITLFKLNNIMISFIDMKRFLFHKASISVDEEDSKD